MRHGSRRAIKIWYRSTAPVSRGGFIYFAVKGIWTHAIAALLLAILTFGLSWLIYPVFARQIVETHYLVKVRLGLLHGPVGCSGAAAVDLGKLIELLRRLEDRLPAPPVLASLRRDRALDSSDDRGAAYAFD